jgi:hypothetical protein
LAARLNKEEAAKLKPKPAKPPSQSGATRPAPSQSAGPSAAVAVMPPMAPPSQSSTAAGSFGSAVPQAKTSAMVFADFLYPDLV